MIEFKIDRDSVCTGDDIDPHTTTYTVNSSTKFSDIFLGLINKNYFPRIFGNDVVWTLCCGKDDLVSWRMKENKLYSHFVTEEAAILSNETWVTEAKIHFIYYSSFTDCAEHIFVMFGGNKYNMENKGVMAEYQSFYISQMAGEGWGKDLFIPHNTEELYKKLVSENFKGKLLVEKDFLTWILSNGIMIKVFFSEGDDEGYINISYYDRKEYQITHWHPAVENIYKDLVDIDSGQIFWVKRKKCIFKSLPTMMDKNKWNSFSEKQKRKYTML